MRGHLVFLHQCSLTLAQTVMVKYGSPYILIGRRHEVARYQGGVHGWRYSWSIGNMTPLAYFPSCIINIAMSVAPCGITPRFRLSTWSSKWVPGTAVSGSKSGRSWGAWVYWRFRFKRRQTTTLEYSKLLWSGDQTFWVNFCFNW